MPQNIQTEVVFHGGMRFEGKTQGGKTVQMDFAQPGQAADGFEPLELLLTSLAGCSGQVVVGLLSRMGQQVDNVRVVASGTKRDIHPKALTRIELLFEFRGAKLDPSSVEKALALSEERYCPVWAMLKSSVPISAKFSIA